MRQWNVYSSDGKTIRTSTKSLEYNGEYMGSCSLTISFESKSPIDFQIGDYIDYRNERFYLNVVPAAKKQCSVNGAKDAFVYDNVKFDSVIDELVRCNFLDIVENDTHIHWTALPTFSFYCSGVYDLASRIKANLDRCYGNNKWTISFGYEEQTRNDISISIDNQSVWDALTLLDTNFKTNFIIRGRHIVIGSSGNGIGHTFKYGVGNGLLSLERTIDDSQKVITRLRAYGNTTNIPTSYYKYLSMYVQPTMSNIHATRADSVGHSNVDVSIICNDKWANDILSYGRYAKVLPNNTSAYEYIRKQNIEALLTIKYNYGGVDRFAKAVVLYYHNDLENKNYVTWYVLDNTMLWMCIRDTNGTFGNYQIQLTGSSALDLKYILSKYPSNINNDNYPNNMAVTRLMLPNFSIKQGEEDCGSIDEKYKGYKLVYNRDDVYIDSPNIDKIGLREGTVYIDGTDNEATDADIYPSFQGITKDLLNDAGINVNLKPNDNGCLDEIDSASTCEDKGDSDIESGIAASMFVWIKDCGFNIWDYRTSETPTIYMKSGLCVGREFEITNIVKDERDGYFLYKLTISRKADNDLNIVYPNSEFPIKSGDEFVLLHIKMPDVYYQVASQKLLRAALIFFADNDKTRLAYTPEIDNIWMARQHDEATENGEESIYMTIKEGDKMMFDEEQDLGFKGNVFINTLKITESEDSLIPQFDITLEDKKSVSSLQRTLSQVSQSFGGGGSGDGLTIEQVKALIRESGSGYYISKVKDDKAKGLIAFNKGIETFAEDNNIAADGIVEYPIITEE